MALRKIDLMHRMFGSIPNKTCKECSHLVKHTANRSYYKCEVYGVTNSEASDWRLKYPACGLLNKEATGLRVMKIINAIRDGTKEIPQIEGQIKMEGIK